MSLIVNSIFDIRCGTVQLTESVIDMGLSVRTSARVHNCTRVSHIQRNPINTDCTVLVYFGILSCRRAAAAATPFYRPCHFLIHSL